MYLLAAAVEADLHHARDFANALYVLLINQRAICKNMDDIAGLLDHLREVERIWIE